MIYKSKERKRHGASIAETNISTLALAPFVKADFLSVPQGDAFNNRDGHIIRMSGMKVAGSLHSNGTSVGPIAVRMAFVQHVGRIETTDTYFTRPDGLDTNTLSGDSACIHWDFNRDAYRVLSNRIFLLNTDAQKDNVSRLFSKWIKPLIRTLRYDSGSTTSPARNVKLVMYARRLDNDETTGTNIELTLNNTMYYVDV